MMTAAEQERPFGLQRIPDNLLREPLDYILADHFRQLKLCGFLDDLVAHPKQGDSGAKADAIRTFLEKELPLHAADEEDDLFPSLRKRCGDEEGIGELLDGLAQDHETDARLVKRITESLAKITAGTRARAPHSFRRTALALTANERRHVALENDVVLPLARRRLTFHDLEHLGRAMAARRNIAYPD